MDPVTIIASRVGGAMLAEISKKLLPGVIRKFNPSDIDKAIEKAFSEAQQSEYKLFYECEPDFIEGFINKFLEEKGLSELQKPLNNEAQPNIDLLTKIFTKAALNNDRMNKIAQDCVHPWMEIFVNTYFKNIDPYFRFQVAKEDYFKQLANWFDDVKFAGIAVAGQEVEKSEKLENIFVMPDVQEDVTVKNDSVIDNEKLLNEIISDASVGKRQQELFLEQRQRALSNRSGEKILAAQLLTEKNSKKKNSQKFVLLGAPGSGKTTLLSYFAVMLAQDEAKKAENQEKLGLDPNVDYLPILIRMRDYKKLGEEILRDLVALEVNGRDQVGEKVFQEVFSTLCRFHETVFEQKVLELLKAEANNIDKLRLQEYRAELGDKEGAVSTLIELLSDDDSLVRNSAAFALGDLGKDSQPVVDELVKLLADDHFLVRNSAAQTLGDLGRNSQPVVDELVKLLADDHFWVRNGAAEALGKLGRNSQPLVEQLVKLLADDDSNVRNSAAEALGKLGKDSQPVVDGLVKLLADNDSSVRNSAAKALGNLGKDSQPVVDELVKLLADNDSSVRYSAAGALGNLGKYSQPVVDGFVKLLADDDFLVRYSAAGALGNLGKDLNKVLPQVVQWLEENQDSKSIGSGIDVLWNMVTSE